MCHYHEEDWPSEDVNHHRPSRRSTAVNAAARSVALVESLRERLAETEARLARARAREAALSRQLSDMKRFVSVMEILEGYLDRRLRDHLVVNRLLSSPVP